MAVAVGAFSVDALGLSQILRHDHFGLPACPHQFPLTSHIFPPLFAHIYWNTMFGGFTSMPSLVVPICSMDGPGLAGGDFKGCSRREVDLFDELGSYTFPAPR